MGVVNGFKYQYRGVLRNWRRRLRQRQQLLSTMVETVLLSDSEVCSWQLAAASRCSSLSGSKAKLHHASIWQDLVRVCQGTANAVVLAGGQAAIVAALAAASGQAVECGIGSAGQHGAVGRES